MCIAICKGKYGIIPKTVLEKCFQNNPDGAGFAYPADDGQSVIIERGFFSFKKFWKAFKGVQEDRPMLIHFRLGTSGGINEANCHPFQINERHAFIHNGNIEDKLDLDKNNESSDTATFVEQILRPVFADPEFEKQKGWTTDAFEWLMKKSIEYKNKMAILGADGTIKIFNKFQGEEEKQYDSWFSNKTYKEDRKKLKGTTVSHIIDGDFIKEVTTYNNGHSKTRILSDSEVVTFLQTGMQTASCGITEKDILSAEEKEALQRELDDQQSEQPEGEARLAALI